MELVPYLSFALSMLGFLIFIRSILKLYRQAQMCFEINTVSFMANIALATALMYSSSLLGTTNTESSPFGGDEVSQFSQNKPSKQDNATSLKPETTDHF
jgi:hypothetical protein